jgi:predicted transcriptional regulator
MSVLLSIKPQYVEKIVDQTKKYEFRKKIFRETPDKIFIYSTSPEKKIIGTMSVSRIICDKPKNLWKKCRKSAGIDEDAFFDYFRNVSQGYALAISTVDVFEKPVDPSKSNIKFIAPQSFYYFNDDDLDLLIDA